jgi:predicted Rossmann fold flavoprotein
LNNSPNDFDVVIVGAGAAGLMCAITAGKRGLRVAVLDHNNIVGAKILISGGGRCNFTNIGTTPANFISNNPHFARSALSRYTPQDFLALIAKHKIAWHEKTLGQLFCDESAKQIVKMLRDECASASVKIIVDCKITDMSKADEFRLETSQGVFTARNVVLATGGLSIPKMGATGFALDVAKKFGLKLVAPKPGLVPLKASADELAFYTALSGVALPAIVKFGKTKFAESVLFTHRGLSGPAILQISSYMNARDEIEIDFAPGRDLATELKRRRHERPKVELKTLLAEFVPQRLAESLSGETSLEKIATRLKSWRFKPAETEGYAKAEVMVGGVDTDDLSSKTMEAKQVPGLYVIGEAVDVTGWLGGYNFQWAWASGVAAGQGMVLP